MNREQYMQALANKLSGMTASDREEAIHYYEEYFDEAGIEEEEKVIGDLGTPEQVAKQILADYAVKEVMKSPKSPKKNIYAIWFIVLAIFASPIAFPLAMAVISVLFAGVVAIAACVFALGITLFSVGAAGVGVFLSGLAMLTTNLPTALVLMGPGLVMIGVTLLSLMLVSSLVIKVIPMMIASSHRMIKKMIRKGERR